MNLLEVIEKLDPDESRRFIYALPDEDGYFRPYSEATFTQGRKNSQQFMAVRELQLRLSQEQTPNEIIALVNSLPKPEIKHARAWRRRHGDRIKAYETSDKRREAKRLHARKKRAEKRQSVV